MHAAADVDVPEDIDADEDVDVHHLSTFASLWKQPRTGCAHSPCSAASLCF